MGIDRGNPFSIDVIQLASGEEIEEALGKQIKELVQAIKAVDFDLIGWLRKQAELVRLRLGHRKPRSIPWKGASNISIPLIDGIIRRYRPGIVSLVLDADPAASFTAQSADDFEAARLAEQFFTYLLLTYMDSTYTAVQLVDLIAWRGHAYTREAWSYRTKRAARIVPVSHLFPNGVQATIEEMQAAAAQAQQPQPQPADIVVSAIESEYKLDRDDEAEGAMMLAAAQKILDDAEYVKLVYRTVCEDRPSWQVIDPINVIVPQNQDPENADFFTIVHHMRPDDLRALAIDGHLPEGRVSMVLEDTRTSQEVEISSDNSSDGWRTRIQDVMDRIAGRAITNRQADRSTGTIPIWEIFCNLDLNGDGERERCVVWYDARGGRVLTVLDYPFPFESWPITYYPFEAAPRPIDNRGIADMLRPLQKVVNAYHNARIDAAQIVLAPAFTMRTTSGNYKRSVNYRPGGIIPVSNVGDLAPVPTNLNILTGLLQEEQSNRREAETYIGIFDATLLNRAQRPERRTAAEVNAIQGISSNIFGLDAKIFQVALSKSFTKIWQLYVDLGPQELFFRVTGEDMPQRAKKHEIARSYDIRAAGTPANTNRSFQIAAMERILSAPTTLPLAQAGRFDLAEAFRLWVSLIDYNAGKRLIRSPEEGTNAQLVAQAGALVAEAQGQEPPPSIV